MVTIFSSRRLVHVVNNYGDDAHKTRFFVLLYVNLVDEIFPFLKMVEFVLFSINLYLFY